MQLHKIKSPGEWLKLRKLYKASFPEYEQKPLWLVWYVMHCNKADVWIAERDGEFAGIAITMNGPDLILLDYLAVSEHMRGTGAGTQILKMLQEYYADKRFFLEIENVYDKNADNLSDRLRRKSFYLKNDMQEMKIMANVFGAELELLTHKCEVSFEDYYALYCSCYRRWAAENVKQIQYPTN